MRTCPQCYLKYEGEKCPRCMCWLPTRQQIRRHAQRIKDAALAGRGLMPDPDLPMATCSDEHEEDDEDCD